MATKKLSQIDPAATPPAASDAFVGVRNGNSDVLFSQAQMAEVFATGGGAAANPTHAVAVTPPVTFNGSYGAGVVIGGVMQFTGVFDVAQTSGRLTFARVTVKTKQDQGFALYLFTQNPAASGFADNVLAAINQTDAPNVLTAIPLGPQNQLGNHTVYAAALDIAVDLPTANLWGVLVPDGPLTTPLSSTSDVTVELHSIPD
jgi:hypothetical protein